MDELENRFENKAHCNMSKNCSMIQQEIIDKQKAEIERLTKWKDKLQDTKNKMKIKNIAKLSSYGAYIDEEFIYTDSLVEGKNVIVGNIAEYMYDLEQEIERLTEENKKLSIKVWNYEQPARTPLYSSESMVHCNLVTCYNENFDLKAKNAELQKQVDELMAKNSHLDSENTRLICEMDKMLDEGWDIMDEEADGWYKKGCKDTAKEILLPLIDCEKQIDPLKTGIRWSVLKGFCKKFGVEVE